MKILLTSLLFLFFPFSSLLSVCQMYAVLAIGALGAAYYWFCVRTPTETHTDPQPGNYDIDVNNPSGSDYFAEASVLQRRCAKGDTSACMQLNKVFNANLFVQEDDATPVN